MRRYGDIRRIADDLVADSPFPALVALGEIEGSCYDPDGGVASRESAAEILEVCPVISVEAFADLRTHI